jgi:hypothetical protein
MLIFEVENSESVDTKKLMALTQFLSGRASDTDSKKQISVKAFVDLAKSIGVNITSDNIGDLIAQEPLSNMLMPYDPSSNIIQYKGNEEADEEPVDSNQSEQMVAAKATAAAKKNLGKKLT